MNQDVLCYDIETRIFGKPDPQKDGLRLFLCYSYKTKKYYVLKNIQDIQKVIDAHKYLVGFNVKAYDNPILIKEGVRLDYKIIIDMYDIFKKRASQMKIEKGMLGDLLMSYSLDFISKTIGIADDDTGKMDIDYNIFKKKIWSEKELDMVIKYGKRDVEVTKNMYEYIESYFKSFKEFLNEEDVRKKVYLTCSTASFAYKAICKEMNLAERYDSFAYREEKFEGGYVAYPPGDSFSGNIFLFDYSSLYPNMFIQGNLFGSDCECCADEEKWSGDGFFKIGGKYCRKKLSKFSETLKKFYAMRQKLKKEGNPLEYSIKIILNSSYGAVSNPVFASIYNLQAAEDCTALGRQIIIYTRKRFREEGYKNLMSDTDSVCVLCPEGKTKEDAQLLANKIVEELQKYFPFAW